MSYERPGKYERQAKARNRMAHGYFELNMDIIWNTVATYLNDLIQKISEIKGASGLKED